MDSQFCDNTIGSSVNGNACSVVNAEDKLKKSPSHNQSIYVKHLIFYYLVVFSKTLMGFAFWQSTTELEKQ